MSLAYYNWQNSPYAGGDSAPVDGWVRGPEAVALIAEYRTLELNTLAGSNRAYRIERQLAGVRDNYIEQAAPRNSMGDTCDDWRGRVPSVDDVLDAAVAS